MKQSKMLKNSKKERLFFNYKLKNIFNNNRTHLKLYYQRIQEKTIWFPQLEKK